MRNSSGFTLLEVLVVLALFAIVATAAPLVDYTLLDRMRVMLAVRTVTARIYKAEAGALAQNIAIPMMLADLQGGQNVVVRLDGGLLSRNAMILWLYPDGSATAAAVVVGAGRYTRTLTINSLDGHVDQGG